MIDEIAFAILILLIWSALSRRKEPRHTGFYLEPMGSHETDPFTEQDNPRPGGESD